MGLKENERNLTVTVYIDDFPRDLSTNEAFVQLVSFFKELAKTVPASFVRVLDKYPLAEKLIDAIDKRKKSF